MTALPTLYFRRGRPANAVPYVDLEKAMADEGTLAIGARSVRDLTWKEGLDAFTCTECGRCKDACPTFLTGKPLSLKWVNDSVKHHLLEQRKALAADGPADMLPALVPGVISDETLWSCTTCGYCEAACPIELEHLPKFYRLRQHRVMMDGEFPHELRAVFNAYEVQSNPWGLPADSRGDWAAAAGVPILRDAAHAREFDYLFYVGSAESFDVRGQKIAAAFAKVLRSAGVTIAILGPRETSTGECVRRAGNEMLFQQLATTLIATFSEFGIRRIVTCDPHAFNTLRNEYPALGGSYEVLHHTQLIARLLDEGRLRVRRQHERVIYHEPCYLSRHNGEYEAPRAILRAITRDAPLEFDLSRERAMCCGAGGARMWMEEKIGKRINIARVEQALPKAPRVIATACPYCAVMISDGTKALVEASEIVRARHRRAGRGGDGCCYHRRSRRRRLVEPTLLIALLSDIHANLEALEACLGHARERGVERYAFLGDFVGYGADATGVIETVERFADGGRHCAQGKSRSGSRKGRRLFQRCSTGIARLGARDAESGAKALSRRPSPHHSATARPATCMRRRRFRSVGTTSTARRPPSAAPTRRRSATRFAATSTIRRSISKPQAGE